MINEMNKIKIYKELAMNCSRKIKITHGANQDYYFALDQKARINDMPAQFYWFAKIVTMKMIDRGCDIKNPYVPELKFQPLNSPPKYISGIIYKLSQHLHHWELRYVVIGPGGLSSYKKEGTAESFKVTKDTALELWTRFDVREKMLIIKLSHSGRKTEFAIPITDYTVQSPINWLYAFYRLVF